MQHSARKFEATPILIKTTPIFEQKILCLTCQSIHFRSRFYAGQRPPRSLRLRPGATECLATMRVTMLGHGLCYLICGKTRHITIYRDCVIYYHRTNPDASLRLITHCFQYIPTAFCEMTRELLNSRNFGSNALLRT